ncbi:MAG: glycosyltransferase [Bacteroidetes bacterium]|nr:glycosyltransferase [Bacteroidota bacterium]
MCLKSVKDEEIVYIDGGSTDKSKQMAKEYGTVIYNKYDQLDKMMNGKQRNIYLNYVKEKYPDDWCLVLDADEVVQDINKIKQFIETAKPGVYCPRMRHFIGDFGHEDATRRIHVVPNRLFKISESDKYPEVEHPVLTPKSGLTTDGMFMETTIWHLGHAPNIFAFKDRYESNVRKSNMHTPKFLRWWYLAHLFGRYPISKVDLLDIPDTILNAFDIDKDELYFEDRREFELKHFIETMLWKDMFKCKTAMLFGCGLGQRVACLNKFGVEAKGIDISKWAIEHSYCPDKIELGDITKKLDKGKFDLTVAYDLLEHVDYDKLPVAINNLINNSNKYILVSVPTQGDINLENDPTHKIKETMEWWIKQFTDKGLKLLKTPDYFPHIDQVMIFEK